nr:PREDICTED: adenosine 3'-phospho 5'-phosphosulfate transporter 2 isoform X2 [Bemisia tabaci]
MDPQHVRIPMHENVSMGKQPTVNVLCLDVTRCSKTLQFLLCTLGVFVLYLLYGYLQEFIFQIEGFKPFGWYLTLIQFGLYTIFGWIECTLSNTVRRVPFSVYALLAFLTLGTMGFSNSSLGYLNYPTQVIFKCCKLVPVMLGGILIQRKVFSKVDSAAACCMCIGLIAFILADSKVSPVFSLIGVFMISFALLCDAAIGNVQEKAIKQYGATNAEIVYYSYSIGFIYLFFIMLISGNLHSGFAFCREKPSVYFYAFLFSISGYLGIQIVLTLVRTCDALTAVTVTTCRKAVTIALSFILFDKPFTIRVLNC